MSSFWQSNVEILVSLGVRAVCGFELFRRRGLDGRGARLRSAAWMGHSTSRLPLRSFSAPSCLWRWYGGTGPGLLAVLLAIVGYDCFFIDPPMPSRCRRKTFSALSSLRIAAIFVVWLTAAQRRAAKSLGRARDDLQNAVQDLARLNDLARGGERRAQTGGTAAAPRPDLPR